MRYIVVSFCCLLSVSVLSSPNLNPLVTNGLSHPYHLDESTFKWRCYSSDFSFSFYRVNKQNSPRGDVLRRHIWGYSVSLCPIKRTPCLFGLSSVKVSDKELVNRLTVTVSICNLSYFQIRFVE